MNLIYSPLQLGIFEEVKTGSRNIFIGAGPGSAKSTTLEHAIPFMPQGSNVGVFAFNRHIADALQERVPRNVSAITAHKHGRNSLAMEAASMGKRLGKPDEWKYVNIAQEALESMPFKDNIKKKMKFELKDLILLALNTRTEYGQGAPAAKIDELCFRYNISVTDPILYSLVAPCVLAGVEMWEKTCCYDFIDMTTLPVMLDMRSNMFDQMMVDEGQDLNDAQLTVLLRSLNKGGRIIEVGDRYQSIMGFTGAMPDAVDQFVTRTDAIEMPLSICYRCPPNHLEIARHVAPELMAFKTVDGPREFITSEDSFKMLAPGDFCICRLTAPLVKHCLFLIARGTPAMIKGQDVGRDLVKFAESADYHRAADNDKWEGFPAALRAEVERQSEKMSKERREFQLEIVMDKAEALIALYEHFSVTDIHSFCSRVSSLFVDRDIRNAVMFCTVHKSKGLEGERIFILDGNEKRNYWPIIKKGQANWQLEQERNLIFVGTTRSKHAMYFINVKSKHPEREHYIFNGGYASLGQGAETAVKELPKVTRVEQPKEPIVINTDRVQEKKEKFIRTFKENKEKAKEAKKLKVKKPKWIDQSLPLFKPALKPNSKIALDDYVPTKRIINRKPHRETE